MEVLDVFRGPFTDGRVFFPDFTMLIMLPKTLFINQSCDIIVSKKDWFSCFQNHFFSIAVLKSYLTSYSQYCLAASTATTSLCAAASTPEHFYQVQISKCDLKKKKKTFSGAGTRMHFEKAPRPTSFPSRAETQASEASHMAVRSWPPSRASTSRPPAKAISCLVR